MDRSTIDGKDKPVLLDILEEYQIEEFRELFEENEAIDLAKH